ncbi:MAG: cyclic nucleotide-binding domain-containing protein [Bacillota bacterium]
MSAEKVNFLAKVEELSELNNHELNELAADFFWEEYAQGNDMLTQGQKAKGYFILVEGNAEVLDSNKDGGLLRVNTFHSGDAFGARSLLTGGPAPFTVRCITKCRVLLTSEEQFARMLNRWPQLYRKLISRMSRNLDQVSDGLWEARNKEFLRIILQHSQYVNKFYGYWGSPKTTKLIEEKIGQLTQSRDHLLVIGERGTGRQMMAWYLHKCRFGESAPFVSLDGRDLENQLGNHIFETGSSDSCGNKSSLLEFATGGTLYIEDINQLSARAQLKLAENLRYYGKDCLLVGSLLEDVELLQNGVIPELLELFTEQFKIRSLRERKRDIPFLAQGILEKLSQQHGRKTPVLDHEATKLLLSHNYRQGNVTEFIQVIERAFFLAEDDVIRLEHVFFGPTAKKGGGTFDLLSFPLVKRIIKNSSFLLWLRRITAVIFISIMILMFIVPQASIKIGLFVLVWGLWWPFLAIISPLFGRVWCTVCPFAYVMEIVQNKLHWSRPVPDLIKKYDYLLVTFLFIFILWLEIILDMRTNPVSTSILLGIILGLAIFVGVIYTRHTWCHHMCPLGGFVGMASIGAMLEVRADATICLNKCTTYDCYKGNSIAPGCPMSQHAPFVDNNLDCKLCFNCARNCPNNAVKFNLRIPGREVWNLLRVNQGFVIFIGVSLAILFPINYFESVRDSWTFGNWNLWFSLYYWGAAVLAGLITKTAARPFETKAASKRIKIVFSLIPIVIAGHIIYQLHFLPGIDSIFIGLFYKTSTGIVQSLDLSFFKLGQYFALLAGLILTVFTLLMVLKITNKKTTDNAKI